VIFEAYGGMETLSPLLLSATSAPVPLRLLAVMAAWPVRKSVPGTEGREEWLARRHQPSQSNASPTATAGAGSASATGAQPPPPPLVEEIGAVDEAAIALVTAPSPAATTAAGEAEAALAHRATATASVSSAHRRSVQEHSQSHQDAAQELLYNCQKEAFCHFPT
jgi:hypothetical protein